MLLLAFETSAKAASVALFEGNTLLGEQYQNTGLTHSQTLMVMAQDLLTQCGKKPQQVEAVAVANGPGSFTGVRIGVAAAKGFAWGGEIPLYSVSTLEAMALGIPTVSTDYPSGGARAVIRSGENGLLIPVGDATGLYEAMKRLIEEPELAQKLSKNGLALRQSLSVDTITGQWLDFIGEML